MRALSAHVLAFLAVAVAIFACGADDETSDPEPAVDPPVKSDAGATIDGSVGDGSTSDGSSETPDTGAPDTGGPPQPFVTVTNETMQFDGETRSYLLARPTDYETVKSYPLVIAFHGNPGTAAGLAQILPFDAVSEREAIIAYPQALENAWDLYTPTDANVDMGFIQALPAEIKAKKANIDTARVYGFGYSGGAFFLTQFTCRFGGVFKAISVNAGGGPDEEQMGYGQHPNGCYVCPGGPVPIIVTHGGADTEVVPASGDFTKSCYGTYNGCSGTLTATTPSPCQQYVGCSSGRPVKWCLIPGLGHGIWSEATKEAWAFFKAAP